MIHVPPPTSLLRPLRALRAWLPLLLLALPVALWGEPQDPPEFSDHTLPDPRQVWGKEGLDTGPRDYWLSIVDIGVLFFALSLTTFFVLKSRNRKGVFWTSIFALGYFGFYREGCVCAIGSIQNVTSALFNPAMAAPLVVLVYFFLPLLFSALFGRSYCASVCPHGAIQDLVVVKPIDVPQWLDKPLGLLPYIFLGLGVFFAAISALDGHRLYIICDYDPFIPLFRMTGSPAHLGMGALFLIAGMFIGRPYCRYMCPYGVLLRLFSYVAKWNVTIFKTRCIDCALCEYSCPFGAINPSTPVNYQVPHKQGKGRLVLALCLLPVIVGGMGWFFNQLSTPIAYTQEKVWVADLLGEHLKRVEEYKGKGEPVPFIEEEVESLLYPKPPVTAVDPEAYIAEAKQVEGWVSTGTWWLGGFIGLVIAIRFISFCIRRKQPDFEADKGSCYSCARCYDYCPESNGEPVQFETGGHIRL